MIQYLPDRVLYVRKKEGEVPRLGRLAFGAVEAVEHAALRILHIVVIIGHHSHHRDHRHHSDSEHSERWLGRLVQNCRTLVVVVKGS